jgi:uncharacterized membrane protein HdeD (DUF308 family)
MSLPHGQRATQIGAAVANAVREHSKFFLAEGIILVLLGALAIFLPLFATITITIILGWIFLASGIIGMIATFGARLAPGLQALNLIWPRKSTATFRFLRPAP